MSQVRRSEPWWGGLLVIAGCSAPNTESVSTGTGSATVARSTEAAASDAVATVSASSAVGSASPPGTSGGTVSAKDFCARADQIGKRNLAQAPFAMQENSPALNYVKSIHAVPKECAARVESNNVEFHADVALRCLAAAEKCGPPTTFYTFAELPECEGVLTGKLGAGKPALFAEECAAGLTFVKNRCVEAVAMNGDCDEYPGGILGKADNGERCQPGALCFQTGFGADGLPLVFKCLAPQALGARCKLDTNQCQPGSSCYQGKCRQRAALGESCMRWHDCAEGLACAIEGGVFGRCQVSPLAPTCRP